MSDHPVVARVEEPPSEPAPAAPLRVGVAGLGFIGPVHARSARLAGATLAGVAAGSPGSAAEGAARLGALRAFDSAEEMVVSDEVDVVHLCTPNHLHAPLAEAALNAGKHVICEKPLAADPVQAAHLADLASQTGLLAAVPFVYRFYPVVREARQRVATGQTGALRLLHGAYLQDWMSDPEDDNWRVDPELGGGSRAFADIGSHWCDLVEFVSGERIAEVSAQMVTALPERSGGGGAAFTAGDGSGHRRAVRTEDIATVIFRTESGVPGSVVVSQVSPGRKNGLRMEVAGASETLAFTQEEPETLWVGRRRESLTVARDADAMSPQAARYVTLPPGHPQGYADCFDAFVRDAYEAIRGGSPDGLPRFSDGARAASITAAVLEAAVSRQWVAVKP